MLPYLFCVGQTAVPPIMTPCFGTPALHVMGDLNFTLLSSVGTVRRTEFYNFEVWRLGNEWRIRVTDPPSVPGPNQYDEAASFEGGYMWKTEARFKRPSPDPRRRKFDRLAHVYPEKYPFTSQPFFIPLWVTFCWDCGYEPSITSQRSAPPIPTTSRVIASDAFLASIELSTTKAEKRLCLHRLDVFTDGIVWQNENPGEPTYLKPPYDKRFHHIVFQPGDWGTAGDWCYPSSAVFRNYFPLEPYYPERTRGTNVFTFEKYEIAVTSAELTDVFPASMPEGPTFVTDWRYSKPVNYSMPIGYAVTNAWLTGNSPLIKAIVRATYGPKYPQQRAQAGWKRLIIWSFLAAICLPTLWLVRKPQRQKASEIL